MKPKNSLSLAVFATLAIAVGSAHGALVAYEGFQYADAYANSSDYVGNSGQSVNSLHGQSNGNPSNVDATGLAGTWDESTLSDNDDWFIVQGSLAFGDQTTSGNRVVYNSLLDQSNATRSLSTAAQTTLDSSSSMFFSILINPTEVASASRGGFAITNTNLAGGGINNSNGTYTSANSLVGFGFGSTGSHQWQAYGWDGTNVTTGGGAMSPTQGQTYMLVGQISFNTGVGGEDEFSLYNYLLNEGSVEGGTLDQVGSTLALDIDETSLDLLNLNRQRYFEADEIRIGTSLTDVVSNSPIPEPTTALLGGLGALLLLRRRR